MANLGAQATISRLVIAGDGPSFDHIALDAHGAVAPPCLDGSRRSFRVCRQLDSVNSRGT